MDNQSHSSLTSLDDCPPAQLLLFSHEFPTDDVQDLFRSFHRHQKGQKYPLLAVFLSACDRIILEEVSKLPKHYRDEVPHFNTVTGLAMHFDKLRKGPLGGSWEGAFLCIYQLSALIGHFESTKTDFNAASRNATTVGMSIGLFAAAATAASSSLADLAYNGPESVRISFAFCAHVGYASNLVESRGVDEGLPSWAYVVTGVSADTVQEQLDQYNHETTTSNLNKVMISHTDKGSVGVTGPPARLRHLFRYSEVLRHSKHSSLQIHGGLCHVSNVYVKDDVDTILNAVNVESWRARSLRLPLLSPSTGSPFPAENAAHLFELIVEEALFKPLHFDNLADGTQRILGGPGLFSCDIFHFRTSVVSKALLSSFEHDLSQAKIVRHDFVDWTTQDYESFPRNVRDSKLAVVGMACRMPGGANDTELFWQLLEDGRDVHTTVPIDRFDLSSHFDPTGTVENSIDTPYGNFIDAPGLFDPGFFNMSPREAEQTDPMQRLALVTAYEALEMAGFVSNRTPSSNPKRVATFYGEASDDYREVNANQNIGTYGIPGTERAFGNGRINYFFKFGGPSFNLDTACSSGLAAVHAACISLWAGDSDTVIAGGLNVITNPDIYCMLTKGHFLSKTGQCKVWDKDADGYCRSDGIGSVVIKHLDAAVADNDRILATIVAGATNHSCDAISITHPHVENQKENYNQVLGQAGINPLSVSHVELHGTGTQAGDAVESQSVLETFAPLAPQRKSEQRLSLGALKANIGHGEAAAGIASLIKVLLMYQKNLIPRHVGIKGEINPIVQKHLQNRNAGLVFETTPWVKQAGKKRYSIVNSFGAHGGNTTLLLEDAPEKFVPPDTSIEHLKTHIVTVSAKSKKSLQGNIKDLLTYLNQPTQNVKLLADLSYTLVARRMHHSRRITASVTTIEQLRGFLASSLESSDTVRPINASTSPAVVFAFTGQGSFYEGAGKELYQYFPNFRHEVKRLDRIVQQLGLPSVESTIGVVEGASNSTVTPTVAQLSILIIQIALTRLWLLFGVKADVVIGHSLGEYAALVAAGVLSPADAIYLVGERAKLLETSCKTGEHAMLSVRASKERISSIVGGRVKYEVSCLNTAEDTVISGLRDDINVIRSMLEAQGHRHLLLDLPYAFHSAQLDPVLDKFENLAMHVSFKTPGIPVVSPLLGQCVFEGRKIDANYLRRASREAVNFTAALDSATNAGLIDEKTIWVELGHHPTSSSFARGRIPNIKTFPSLHKQEDNFTTISGSLAGLHNLGVNINWGEYYRPYEKSFDLLHLKHYHWNDGNYFIPYTGNWTLDKAHAGRGGVAKAPHLTSSVLSLQTTSIQRVTLEEIHESTGYLKAITDIQQADFLDAVNGHIINGHGVVTGSIWADMALTIGEYLYKRLRPGTSQIVQNVSDMKVLESQMPHDFKGAEPKPQLIELEAHIDLATESTTLAWYTMSNEGLRSENFFASATIKYQDPQVWKSQWRKSAYFVSDRITALSSLAAEGKANRLTRSMIYQLFQNVVDYADRYRGMQSAVQYELEAFANVELGADRHGTWHTPPHWIDSVFQMAGFVMNGSDVSNTRDFFYITPGWDELRLAKPLEAGTSYQSYVRMLPSEQEANTFVGDIYTLVSGEIVGVCEGIKFRKIPRVLLKQLFSSRSHKSASSYASPPNEPASLLSKPIVESNIESKVFASLPAVVKKSGVQPRTFTAPQPSIQIESLPVGRPVESPAVAVSTEAEVLPQVPVVTNCLSLIARETGLDIKEFTDDASFIEMGIDSLMSLVLSEKLLRELGVEVKSSAFLECPTVGEFTEWLGQYH